MLYLFIAFFCGVIGIAPLVLATKARTPILTLTQLAGTTLVWWWIFYANTPSTVYPLWGAFGFAVLVNWVIAAVLTGVVTDLGEKIAVAAIFPAALVVAYLITFFTGSNLLRSKEYADMIGTIEHREWTQDIQPKDPKHMRMSTRENALYVAGKALGQAGTIGSQFEISTDYMTLQMIHSELWYVVPLDFAGFSRWKESNGTPGYIMIHGEDPRANAKLVQLDEEKRFRYTPGAYFSDNLERHLRMNGYFSDGFKEFQFEIDENGKPWWVVSLYDRTIVWSGSKITGILLVDPVTGRIIHKSLNEAPEWVDRVIPASIIQSYLAWHGEFSGGWLNSWWGGKNLTEPEEPGLIYGAEQQPDWVTGITSTNNSDDSLVAVAYTNSRTGTTVLYHIPGGGTDAAILDAVNRNQDVQFKHLHGADPQIYNVYDTMASVVPLLNDSHAFQGVAVVNVTNIQMVAIGHDQHEALRKYQVLLAQSGQQVALDQTHALETAEGIVDRFSNEPTSIGSIYYLHLAGIPHGFTGGSSGFPKLPLTKAGDDVRIEYFASGEDFVPMQKFENLSLPLAATRAQSDIRERAEERHQR